MIKKDNFGEISSKEFEVGDMVEWTTWDSENSVWSSIMVLLSKLKIK
jgi:hypothetical protein